MHIIIKTSRFVLETKFSIEGETEKHTERRRERGRDRRIRRGAEGETEYHDDAHVLQAERRGEEEEAPELTRLFCYQLFYIFKFIFYVFKF